LYRASTSKRQKIEEEKYSVYHKGSKFEVDMVTLVGMAKDNIEHFPKYHQQRIIKSITEAFIGEEGHERFVNLNKELEEKDLTTIVETITENQEADTNLFKIHFLPLLHPDSDSSKIKIRTMQTFDLPHMIMMNFDDVVKEFRYGTMYYDSKHRKLIKDRIYLRSLYPNNEYIQTLWV
jgi:hypothetical protein